MSTSSLPLRAGRSDAPGPSSAHEAIDLLVAAARQDHADRPDEASPVEAAATLLRGAIGDLRATQTALAEALIASQDRLLDLKTLARMNARGVASDEALTLLLDKALALTRSCLVVVFEDRLVSVTRGDLADLERSTALARDAIAQAPHDALRPVASGCAMIGALDLDGGPERHIAFFRPAGRPFSTTDVPLLEAVDAALGVMLAFDDFHRRELQQAAVEREHQLASALAQSVITDDAPRSSTVDLFATTLPASLTGGDFYVFGQGDGSIWFAVGDVAGKGLPAAMLMTRAVGACRVAFLAHRDGPVVDVLTRIEEQLFDHLDEAGLFLTLAVGVVDEATCTVTLVNAGHSPVVLVRDGTVAAVPPSVPPLGVVRGRTPSASTFALGAHDRLLVGTDGLVDQSAPDGELFGYDRFHTLLERLPDGSSSRAATAVLDALADFASGSPACDDSTLVVLGAAVGP